MIERSICFFKTSVERRATKGDKRGRPSTSVQRCEGNERREFTDVITCY